MARILLIDDDRDVRRVIQYELEAAGHAVRAASDGAQGMAMQRAQAADVVVTDIFMPEKEGIETIRDLRHEFPAVKIIAISGGGRVGSSFTRELSVVAAELGVSALLQKPFETKELLKSIDAALRTNGT